MLGQDSGITIGLAAVLIGALFVLWWRIEGRFTEERDARSKIEDELAEYKLYVARNHVSTATLKETEERLITAFDRLTARMEQIVSRLDKMAVEMAADRGRRD